MGKVGDNPNGTVWVTEYYQGREVFNYTLPKEAVYSWFVSYADVFTVSVPFYSQNFKLERLDSGTYNVYIPDLDESAPVNFLEDYVQDGTILTEAYPMLYYAIRDVRVLSKIYEEPFGINGVITKILNRHSTVIVGFTIKIGDELWAIVLDEDGRVVHIEEIIIELN